MLCLTFLGATHPQPSIKPLLVQLAATPNDIALRTRIIHIVLRMPHPPPTSEALNEQVGAAFTAFKHAQSTADYQAAADAFAKASLLAPWSADIYYDLALVDEKMQNYAGAVQNLRLYLIASPNARDKDAREQQIGADLYSASQKAAADAAAAQATAAQQARAVADQKALNLLSHWTSGVRFKSETCDLSQIQPPPQLFAAIPAYRLVYEGASKEAFGSGCTEDQFSGSSWHPDFPYITKRAKNVSNRRDSPHDSTATHVGNSSWLVVTATGQQLTIADYKRPGIALFIGAPDGSDPANIQWQCVVPATPTSQPTLAPAWSSLGEPGSYVNNNGKFNLYLSCDRPRSGENAAASYHYLWIYGP